MTAGRKTTVLGFYVSIFLRTGVPFGIFMGLFALLRAVPSQPWSEALGRAGLVCLLGGAFFGVTMSLTLGTMGLALCGHRGPAGLAVLQRRVVEVHGDRQMVVQRVLTALAALPRAQQPTLDASWNLAEVKVGWSWKSWGEVVSARVESDASETHRVYVESRPRLGTTVVDYGKGASNVEAVVAAISAAS